MINMLITDIPTIVNCIKHTINDEREKICIKINGFIFVISLFLFLHDCTFLHKQQKYKKKCIFFTIVIHANIFLKVFSGFTLKMMLKN